VKIICPACSAQNSDTAKFCNECGHTLTGKKRKEAKGLTLKEGNTLKEKYYVIKSLIKVGGMGAVYKAEDTRSKKTWAIKELWDHFSSDQEKEYLLKRFKSEAKLLSELEHTSLPKVIDYFTDNERYYLVMDFVDGCDLATIIASQGNPGLLQEDVVRWGIQICELLDYLHNCNPPIIYRDLKPSNIMLKPDNRIVLIDFGIACALQETSGGVPRTMIGTIGYIAPEQYLGRPIPASDIYSLGGTIYHLLKGSMPVPFSYKPMRSIVTDICHGLEDIVSCSLNLKFEDRYQTAIEVRDALELVLNTEILKYRTLKQKSELAKSKWKISGELPELYELDIPGFVTTGKEIPVKESDINLEDTTREDIVEKPFKEEISEFIEEVKNTGSFDGDKLFDEDFIDFSADLGDKELVEIPEDIYEPEDFIDMNRSKFKTEVFETDNILEDINDEFIAVFDNDVISDEDFFALNDILIEDSFPEEMTSVKDIISDECGSSGEKVVGIIPVKERKIEINVDLSSDMLEEEMTVLDLSWIEDEEEIINISFQEQKKVKRKTDDKIKKIDKVLKITGKKNLKDLSVNAKKTVLNEQIIDKNLKARSCFEEAKKLSDEKNFEKAVSLCEEALVYDPEFLDVYYTLGTFYKQINRSELAVESYKKYLSLKQKKMKEITKTKRKK